MGSYASGLLLPVPMIEEQLIYGDLLDSRYGEFMKSKDDTEWKNRRLGKNEEKKDERKVFWDALLRISAPRPVPA